MMRIVEGLSLRQDVAPMHRQSRPVKTFESEAHCEYPECAEALIANCARSSAKQTHAGGKMRAFRRGMFLFAVLTVLGCETKEGPTGPSGPQGPSGPAGLQGADGASGVSGLQIVSQSFTAVPPAPVTLAVTCPGGKRVLSGGYALSNTGTEVGQSYPGIVSGNEAWIVSMFTPSGIPNNLTIFAICAAANSSGASAMLAAPRIP
jgi:hypothetical protein